MIGPRFHVSAHELPVGTHPVFLGGHVFPGSFDRQQDLQDCLVSLMLTGKENWPGLVFLTSIFSVELPGIEPDTEIALTC